MIDELPEELRALFAAERSAPVVHATTRVVVRAKLASAIGSTPLGQAAVASSLTKLFVVLAISVATGVVAVTIVQPGKSGTPLAVTPTVEVSVPTHVPTLAQLPDPSTSVRPVDIGVSTRTGTQTPAPTEARNARSMTPLVSAHATTVAPVASQADLLQRAMLAMSAGDATRVLELTADDVRLHPDGALAEERDALHIRGLAALHRMDEARAAASQLFAQHPDTVHRARIERALETEELQ